MELKNQMHSGRLPIAAVTENALILHGGIPSRTFQLDELRAVTSEDRCQVRTTIEPKTNVGKLLQGLLWSDPSVYSGIHPNTTRSVGYFYGRDIVSDFLRRHKLHYLIRGHEIAENGAAVIKCGHGESLITVFSHSEYPNGEGSNLGAYIHLKQDGDYEIVQFSRNTKFMQSGQNKLNLNDPYVETLKSLISANRHKLEVTFQSIAPDGNICASKWAEVMAESLSLPNLPWLSLIPSLAPQSNDDIEHVDWKAFLGLYVAAAGDRNCQETNLNMEILHANHKMLMTVFKFLDFNGNGFVDVKEFVTGMDLLNKRLPEERRLKDPEGLFQKIDRHGKGKISVEDFAEVFRVM
jgi:Ca2+-binding EF-hand superfamily protein